MGREFKGKGVRVALGPMMNLGHFAAGGRNWEGFGANPYLVGEAAYETIIGIQNEGVQACAKHYINNEQEHYRTTSSSNVDDRTQHEVYAHPFLRCVMAGVASIMCSYNLINGTWACENDKVFNDILKHQMGFQGYVMSDWQATHSTISAVRGLDMTMPSDVVFNSLDSYFGANLTSSVQNGMIPEERVTSGNSLVDVLYGKYNPSGKLPYTIARAPEDCSAQIVYGDSSEQPQIPHSDGLLIDHRWFDANNITPRCEFGFGLSYTAFEYSKLSVGRAKEVPGDQFIWWDGGVSGNMTGASIEAWLHKPLFKVSFTIKNTGKVTGKEVVQLYISPPESAGEPPNLLRGFEIVELKPGQSKQVELELSRYDLSVWDVERQGWARMDGAVGVWVGGSLRDVRLQGEVF
ncbi:hypothetical protein FRC07_001528 [Ceratobasidium sp. 392]|nr:hypothetical protein FRC07_001528 [Ceratobasidium sp. 392]